MTPTISYRSFPGHKPGQPYNLSREDWLTFVGLPQDIDGIPLEGPALWAELARREAERRFNPLSQLCHSELVMDTRGDGVMGAMRWTYWSTSGTRLEIIEHRRFLTRSAPGYPGMECSDELPQPIYRVLIPTDRDQPGRYHWQRLREGGSYCD